MTGGIHSKVESNPSDITQCIHSISISFSIVERNRNCDRKFEQVDLFDFAFFENNKFQ